MAIAQNKEFVSVIYIFMATIVKMKQIRTKKQKLWKEELIQQD